MVLTAALLAAAAVWLALSGPLTRDREPGSTGAGGSSLGGRAATGPSLLERSPSGSVPSAASRSGSSGRGFSGRGRPGPGRAGPEAGLAQHLRAVRQLGSLLRSGRSPSEAWVLLERAWNDVSAGPAAADIAAACRAALVAHGMGLPTSTGLERHLRGCTGPWAAAWERVVWSMRLAEGVGAAPAELLDRVADQLEATEDRRRALETVMAGPRATQRLLSWLPLFGVGLAQLMGAQPLVVLTTHPLGVPCLGAGLALWWLNRAWAGRLVRAAERDGP